MKLPSVNRFGWFRCGYVNGRQWTIYNPPTPNINPTDPRSVQFGYEISDLPPVTDSSPVCIIPEDGSLTNFASIPRVFWRIAPPVGDGARARYGLAAIAHDELYRSHCVVRKIPNREHPKYTVHVDVDRKFADAVFLAIMAADEVSWWRRKTMYYAVRAFGAGNWSS